VASPWRACLLVFLVHLAVQGLILTRVPTGRVRPHIRFEITAVAISLYERGAFADPYCLPTGPTAHMPPFSPALLALVYRLLGPTLVAGYATWLILIAFHGAMYGMLPWLGVRLGLGPRPGLAAGLVGALLPRLPGYVEGLVAVAIGLMMAAFVRRWTSGPPSATGSLALGLAIGISFHVSPSLLPVALGLVAFELAWPRRPRHWRTAVLTLLGMVLACAPWTWRNYRTLGGLFFIRSNFGLELRMGTDQAAGAIPYLSALGVAWRHPRTSEEEARKVQQLGELEYMRQAGREAGAWIRAHPGSFLLATGERVARFWLAPVDDPRLVVVTLLVALLAALGARRAWPVLGVAQRAALLIPLLTYPLVYYVVGFEPRYRRPLDGLVLLLAAVPLLAPDRSPTSRKKVPLQEVPRGGEGDEEAGAHAIPGGAADDLDGGLGRDLESVGAGKLRPLIPEARAPEPWWLMTAGRGTRLAPSSPQNHPSLVCSIALLDGCARPSEGPGSDRPSAAEPDAQGDRSRARPVPLFP
jgi:hypothetical protein